MAYVLDRDHMGGFHAGSNSHVIQTLQVGAGAFGAPAYWNGHLYYANRRDSLKDFLVENGRLVPTPVHRSPEQFAHPGAIPCVSANGIKDGIVWLVVSPGPNRQGFDSDAILHAYDAADVSHELYAAVLDPPYVSPCRPWRAEEFISERGGRCMYMDCGIDPPAVFPNRHIANGGPLR